MTRHLFDETRPNPHTSESRGTDFAPSTSGDTGVSAALINRFTTRFQQILHELPTREKPGARIAWAGGLAAAAQLHRWGMDTAVQTAAIIHNFVCNVWPLEPGLDAQLTPELTPELAARTTQLCNDYAHIILNRADSGRGHPRARRRVLYFQAAYHDPDLALLATALLWASIEQRRREGGHLAAAAREDARLILCPLLDMLGMQALREELNQVFWPIQLEPDHHALAGRIYDDVHEVLAHLIPAAVCERRFSCVEDTIGRLRGAGRTPLTLDLAVCVPTVEECYRVLFHLHQRYPLVDASFSDHLRTGRINGSRGLHTSLWITAPTTSGTSERIRVNFQIYAQPMEPVNRWGLAAVRRAQLDPRQTLHSPPQAWWNSAQQGRDQIAVAPVGALPETLYVFSPQGQLFRFHRGCTVVDFAYHVHTDLAEQCRRFYINDEPVEPNAVLHHLDIVALEHDPQASGPTTVWLTAAHTTRARNAIERFLNRRGLGLDQGRRILDDRRRHLEHHYGFNLPEHRLTQAVASALAELRLSRPEELLEQLATGRLAADQLLHPLFAEEIARQIQLPRVLRLRSHQLQISQCCRPRPGEDIVGLATRRHGQVTRLRIHRQDCPRIRTQPEHIPLNWRFRPRLTVSEQLEITARDEDELLGDAVRLIYARLPHVTLRRVEAAARHGVARMRLHMEAENQELLDELIEELSHLPNRQIVDVRRLRLPPSELEMADSLSGRAGYNPYSRLPVNEQTMFFGRTHELARIVEWLRSGVGNIWLLGQKRVGKTSLLFHLKQHLLPEWGYVAAFVDFQLLGNLSTGNPFYELAAAIFADLRSNHQLDETGSPLSAPLSAPLRSLFDLHPAAELIAYLRSISSRIHGARGRTRLVLLLDEFSRTTDAYLQNQLDRSFFEMWRGLVQATVPEISFITVVQQQTYNTISRRAQQNLDDPSWHLMELGEKLVLRPLDGEDVRRLIEWPMRNFVEFTPDSVDYVAALTGGNPFLIQAFCFKLAAHMAYQERRQVDRADIETVRQEFMLPTESVFAHFLDMLRGIGNQVSQTLATLAEAHASRTLSPDTEHAAAETSPWSNSGVTFSELAAALPTLPAPSLRRTLHELTTCDILVQSAPDTWAFSSRLFQQWLALNAE